MKRPSDAEVAEMNVMGRAAELERARKSEGTLLEALRAAERSFAKAHACRHLRGQPEGVDAWCECDAVRAAIASVEG